MSDRIKPPSLSVPCIRLSPDLDRQIRAQRLGDERYSDTVRRVARFGLRMAAPVVVWRDDEDISYARVGSDTAHIVLSAARWQTRDDMWGATVGVARENAGDWDIAPICASGRKAPGHPSREAAKQAAEAGLRQWLASLAGGAV